MSRNRTPNNLACGYAFLAYLAVTVRAVAISISSGSLTHAHSNLCTPASWTDIIIFFLGNYVAHALTVPSFHGEAKASLILNALAALFFPAYGLFRGITLIMTFAAFGKTDLEKALRAQALFMVVRSREWMPRAGENVKHSILKTNGEGLSQEVEQGHRSLHMSVYDTPWMTNIVGLGDAKLMISESLGEALHGNKFNELPTGYSYAPAPKEAAVSPLPANEAVCTLLNNYNHLKSVVAVGQALYAIMTLYQAPKDQISQYGYVAYSLTVAPYATMSVVNLIAALLNPDYPETYLVKTSVLVEARNRGGRFHGVVGRLVEDEEATVEPWEDDPSLLGVRGVSFRKRNDKPSAGYLRVDLTTAQSKAQQSEAKSVGLVKEGSALESERPRSAQKLCRTTFELRKRPKDFDFNELKTPILLIPSCSPFRASGDGDDDDDDVTPTEHFIKAAGWKHASSSWDVDFKGSTGSNTLRGGLIVLFTLFIAGIPFAIIGGLSHGYQYGNSTFAQRAWITSWLSIGPGYLLVAAFFNMLFWPLRRCVVARTVQGISEVMRFTLMGITSIGGFVVVGKMLKAYGTCPATGF